MNKNKLTVILTGLCFIALCVIQVIADTGHEGATRKEIGSFITVRKVTISSTTGTELWGASVSRPDSFCFNNSTGTIFVSSNSFAMHGETHTNVMEGMPVLSSTTIALDGSMTGAAYATCGDMGVCFMRCLDGQVVSR